VNDVDRITVLCWHRSSRVCWQITNNTLLLFQLQVVGNDDGGGDGNDEGTQWTTMSQTSSFD
jgi:hypothetical protein